MLEAGKGGRAIDSKAYPTDPAVSAAAHIPRGRALLAEELASLAGENWREAIQALCLQGQARMLPGVDLNKKLCNRCGQSEIIPVDCAACGGPCAYCRRCLQMGRSKVCTPLYYIEDDVQPANSADPVDASFLKWEGRLTAAQQEAAAMATALVSRRNERLLVWAVCGAGKTEVIFQPVDAALRRGQKVMIATPRKDVVLELAPRIQQAFPGVKVIALHGKSPDKWQEARITLSTTHQAIRFYRKFDLVIIDEVDAFPYHNNPMLYYAVERARKPGGNLIYLSATPPKHLLKIPHIRIPARYHRRPLAVPQVLLIPRSRQDALFPELKNMLRFILEHQRQAFFFVPYIESVDKLVTRLITFSTDLVVEGTHSRDPQREQKVLRFRRGQTRILVTTTIMERGVTVPRSDVVIFHADAPVFDEASLVQMSGRAGRSVEDPVGHVIFIAEQKTKEMVKAIKHIQTMNKNARKRGLLD